MKKYTIYVQRIDVYIPPKYIIGTKHVSYLSILILFSAKNKQINISFYSILS